MERNHLKLSDELSCKYNSKSTRRKQYIHNPQEDSIVTFLILTNVLFQINFYIKNLIHAKIFSKYIST